MKISDVLWTAANERLWDGRGFIAPNQSRETCCAVSDVLANEFGIYPFPFDPADDEDCDRRAVKVAKFLRGLGLNTDAIGAFGVFRNDEARQGARYAWLMFAAMYAEEQGL
jgi:hypothetical protein